MRKTLSCALLALMASQAQGATFVANYSTWQKMTPGQKSGFVMGVWDLQANLLYEDSNPYDKANKDGLHKCGNDLDLTGTLLVEAVDQFYKQHPNRWGDPAFLVLTLAMFEICERYINEVRQERGLTRLNLKR